MGVNNLGDSASFKTSVIEAPANKLVVVDFFATWCGPCKAIAPTIVQWSNDEKYADSVHFVKIDVDEVPDVAQEQGIRAMPTFFMFKNGEKVGEVVGADKRALQNKIDALLKIIESGDPLPPFVKGTEPWNLAGYLPILILAYFLYTYFIAGK